MKCPLKAGDKVILVSHPPKNPYLKSEVNEIGKAYIIIKFSGWVTYDPSGLKSLDIGNGQWNPREHFISYPDEIDLKKVKSWKKTRKSCVFIQNIIKMFLPPRLGLVGEITRFDLFEGVKYIYLPSFGWGMKSNFISLPDEIERLEIDRVATTMRKAEQAKARLAAQKVKGVYRTFEKEPSWRIKWK